MITVTNNCFYPFSAASAAHQYATIHRAPPIADLRLNTAGILFISLICLLFSGGTASAETTLLLPQHQPVPGGIALVPIPESLAKADQLPKAYYQNNRVMVLKAPGTNSQWVAAVGIPLSAKTGTHHLNIAGGNPAQASLEFAVKPKAYREQRITLKNKRQVNPLKQDLKRIGREKEEMVAAFREWRQTNPQFTSFIIPVQGEISSPFGLKRFFNNQPRNPHSGLDIAAPEGTPVNAPAGGIVTVTGNYFFNGNTVLINHGNGLVSMYCHMQQIDVQPGATIEQGEQIGTVGKTGRATGPHLHWSVSLNDVRVEPGLLIAESK